MQNLFKPKWIFILNTLPLVVLFAVFYSEFNVIKSLLDVESMALWKSFGMSLGLTGLLSLGYGVYLSLKKQQVSFIYGIAALSTYIPFIYLYCFQIDQIVPKSIPQWMIPGGFELYVGTFLMPTLAYALFILVVHFTSAKDQYKIGKSFLITILIPVSLYLFVQLVLPFWKSVGSDFDIHAILILVITGALLFIFFLTRVVYILATQKGGVIHRHQLAWKIPVSIVLPLIGLLVNNGVFFTSEINDTGIFGDFNSYWFYIIALLNGLFICLPERDHLHYRLLLFIGRCITFTYTLYFFVVFLPFLPLSIFSLFFMGIGFLLLTPLILFVVHIQALTSDYKYLVGHYSHHLIRLTVAGGVCVLPLFITLNYIKDRATLNEALEYIYSADYSKGYDIDQSSLQKTLNVIKYHKENNRDLMLGNQLPYLSSYFNWLVLDNLTLSDSKINLMEKIYCGKSSFELSTETIQNDSVAISGVLSHSVYDKSQNAWKSWIDLEITNRNTNNWFAEYATTFELPEGCWISDYYLYVGEKKESGILAEKKSAMWVFSNIRNENRDPGILYYLTGNRVRFRVFPFAKNEVRKTGIELLHKTPVVLNIDGHRVELGDTDKEDNGFENEEMVYISSKQKEKLKKVCREPYFHFIVDVSKKEYIPHFTKRVAQAIEENKALAHGAKISFVNSYVSTQPLDETWKRDIENQRNEGGFYAERAIKTVLYHSYKSQSKSFPVIVVVTDSIKNAGLGNNFSDWKFACPESNLFYNLTDKGVLESHSLWSNPIEPVVDSTEGWRDRQILEYNIKPNKVVYIPDDNQATIILKDETVELDETQLKERNWESALTMHGLWISQVLHPEISDREWLKLVKGSFKTKVMSPVTSYLVVENEAQKAMLKKKQEQVLSSNKSLDPGEDVQRMSEPGLIILSVFLGFALWYRQKRKQ